MCTIRVLTFGKLQGRSSLMVSATVVILRFQAEAQVASGSASSMKDSVNARFSEFVAEKQPKRTAYCRLHKKYSCQIVKMTLVFV